MRVELRDMLARRKQRAKLDADVAEGRAVWITIQDSGKARA